MKRPRLLLALILGGAIVCAMVAYTLRANSHAREERLQTEVWAALDAYDFAEAGRLLEQSQSETATTELLRATLARRSFPEDFEAAREHLRRSSQLRASRERAEFESLLLDCQQHGPPPGLEDVLLQRAQSDPENGPLIYEAMVRGFLRVQHFTGAIDCLDLWIAEFPQDWRARMWRGAFFEHTALPEFAIREYEAVLKDRPTDRRAGTRLGLLLARTGYDFGAALEHLSSVEATGGADVLVALALCRRALGDPETARQLAERAIETDSDHYRALQLVALLELDDGHGDAALEFVTRLESIQGKVDPSAALRRLLQLSPAAFPIYDTQVLGETLHLKARALRHSGDVAAAEACNRRLRHLQDVAAEIKRLLPQQSARPTDVEFAYRLGVLHTEIGFDDGARHWLTRVLELQPGHAEAREALNNLERNDRGALP